MNARLQTRTNPADRTARSSSVTHRTRYEVRTDETSGAVIVRGCAHSAGGNTVARRVSGGGRQGELYGIGHRGNVVDSANTLTLRGILPVRVEGKDTLGGTGEPGGSGEAGCGRSTRGSRPAASPRVRRCCG